MQLRMVDTELTAALRSKKKTGLIMRVFGNGVMCSQRLSEDREPENDPCTDRVKLSDMRNVTNAELEYLIAEPRKESF